MTDAEIICTFMEPKPITKRYRKSQGWWRMLSGRWIPQPLTLDALWEVEERLIHLGYRDHIDNQTSLEVWRDAVAASTWHATLEQKIRALAAVLRPLVEVTAA